MSFIPAARRRSQRKFAAAPAAAAAGAGTLGSFALKADHQASLNTTTSHVIKNLPGYRNRNEETMDWFQKEYPDYYQAVVFELTPEMKADPNRHYFKATRDFRYNHLISEPMKAWLSHGKKWKNKEKGLVYGPSHLSKRCDTEGWRLLRRPKCDARVL
jgi:hypothetical protein